MVKVEIGQTVMVTDGYGRAKTNVIRGEVVKIGRVWIDVHREGKGWGWRFRLDTQTDGGTIGTPPRFYTLGQWAEKERQDNAAAFLLAQGVMVEYASPWRKRMVELARLMGWSEQPLDEH